MGSASKPDNGLLHKTDEDVHGSDDSQIIGPALCTGNPDIEIYFKSALNEAIIGKGVTFNISVADEPLVLSWSCSS